MRVRFGTITPAKCRFSFVIISTPTCKLAEPLVFVARGFSFQGVSKDCNPETKERAHGGGGRVHGCTAYLRMPWRNIRALPPPCPDVRMTTAVAVEQSYAVTIRYCRPDGKGGLNTITKQTTEPMTMLEALAWAYHTLESTAPDKRDVVSFVSIRQERAE